MPESILCMGLENMYESEHQPRSLQEHKCPLGKKDYGSEPITEMWTNVKCNQIDSSLDEKNL